MTVTEAPAVAGPSTGPATRSSARVRNKSARAIENEQTESLIKAARGKRGEKEKPAVEQKDKGKEKEKEKEEKEEVKDEGDGAEEGAKDGEGSGKLEPGPEEDTEDTKDTTATKGTKRTRAPPKKRKSKYCLCREEGEGPMIECAGCGNWFHFKCIDLPEAEAERIHKYVCAECAQKTGDKTEYVYDIKSFPSPTPDDVEMEDAPKAPALRRTTRNKGKGKAVAEPEAKPEQNAEPAVAAPKEEDPKASSTKEDDHNSEDLSEITSSSESGSDAEVSEGSEDEGPPRKVARKGAPAPAPITTTAGSPPKSPAKSPTTKSPALRRSTSSGQKPKTPTSAVSSTSKTATPTAAALPPARKYVIDKMASTIRGIFGEDKMTPEAAETYGQEVEAALYGHFKETIKGKEVAGGRYKAQFNLLNSSLSKVEDVRADLRQAITDGTLPPAKVALLTGAELANEAQLAVIEAATQESLRQTVKHKENVQRVIAGRDGLENLDEDQDSEMQRDEEDRRESGFEGDDGPQSPQARRTSVSFADDRRGSTSSIPMSPTIPQRPLVKRDSTATSMSPVRPTVELSSAWGDSNKGKGKTPEPEAEMDLDMEAEQDIDLSHIVAEDIDYAALDEDDKVAEEARKAVTEFMTRDVVWSGGIVNPAAEAPATPPVQIRIASARPSHPATLFPRLLPHPVVTITGRVPTAHSLQYLTDRLMDRSKELVPVVFTISPTAKDDERKAWTDMIDFHANRDRHGIYHPYTHPPPGTARELYLIPVRPGDARPDLFGLMDLGVPDLDAPIIVGVFVASKDKPSGSGSGSGSGNGRSPVDAPYPPPHGRSPIDSGYHPGRSPVEPPHHPGRSPVEPPYRRPSHPPHPPHARSPYQPQPPQPQPQPQAHQPAPLPAASAAPAPNLQLQALMASLNPQAIASIVNRPPQAPAPAAPYPPPPAGYAPYEPQNQGYTPPSAYPPPPAGYAAGPTAAPTGPANRPPFPPPPAPYAAPPAPAQAPYGPPQGGRGYDPRAQANAPGFNGPRNWGPPRGRGRGRGRW